MSADAGTDVPGGTPATAAGTAALPNGNTLPPLPFVPEDDPVLPLPKPEEMERALRTEPREFIAFLRERQKKIELRKNDPFRHGYEPAIWHVVDDLLCRGVKVSILDPVAGVPREILGGSEVYLSGGNRASKTEFAAKRLVQKLARKEWQRTWSFHTTGPSSIAMQQPRVWHFLPAEWKQLRRHPMADIKYSPKNGFAGVMPTFVAPNGSQNWFKNYAQSLDTAEGEELDLCWFDELVPMAWIDTVRFRLATRNGQLIITFTAVDGYTSTVKGLIDGARDVLRVPALELPQRDQEGKVIGYETVPRIQQASYSDLKIVYFHIFDNPFGNIPEVVSKAKARGREGILLRCYGVPTKAIGAQFPMFRREKDGDPVHVITREQFRKNFQQGTNKHVVDPCSGRNWAMLWGRAVPDERTLVIYREWPSPGQYIPGVGDPGPWAEPDGDKHDGKRGPAQKPWGFGLLRYMAEILREEGWRDSEIQTALELENARTLPKRKAGEHGEVEEMFERMMDSRFGAAPTLTKNESKTLIESMAEIGMEFEPAPGEHQREGIDQINDLLYYDQDKPIAADNKPRLLIVETCVNLIWALENWTGLDGQHGACKDFIDLLRYFALNPPLYLPPDAMVCRGGGSY